MSKIITRADARALNLDRYFTGEPCRHGHVAERYTTSHTCIECANARGREWTRTGAAAWRQQRSPRDKARDRHRTRAYVADKHGYMPAPHESDCPPRPTDGRCQCCGEHVGADKLMLDHDHKLIGSFMGWVCILCNRLGDSRKRLRARDRYLEARGFTPDE